MTSLLPPSTEPQTCFTFSPNHWFIKIFVLLHSYQHSNIVTKKLYLHVVNTREELDASHPWQKWGKLRYGQAIWEGWRWSLKHRHTHRHRHRHRHRHTHTHTHTHRERESERRTHARAHTHTDYVIPVPWRCLGDWMYRSIFSLTSALVWAQQSASRPGRFTSRERAPSTYWIGGRVNPRASLGDMEKWEFLTLPGLKLRPLGPPACS
jgi:hypothetical protein